MSAAHFCVVYDAKRIKNRCEEHVLSYKAELATALDGWKSVLELFLLAKSPEVDLYDAKNWVDAVDKDQNSYRDNQMPVLALPEKVYEANI